jgi:hypothetical protein
VSSEVCAQSPATPARKAKADAMPPPRTTVVAPAESRQGEPRSGACPRAHSFWCCSSGRGWVSSPQPARIGQVSPEISRPAADVCRGWGRPTGLGKQGSLTDSRKTDPEAAGAFGWRDPSASGLSGSTRALLAQSTAQGTRRRCVGSAVRARNPRPDETAPAAGGAGARLLSAQSTALCLPKACDLQGLAT